MLYRPALLISLLVCPLGLLAQSESIELPMQYADGYGPFAPGFGGIGWERNKPNNSWFATYLPVKGIPPSWKNVEKGMIWLDAYQFVYQNLMAGKLTRAMYEELQSDWSWTPDTTGLSAKPIRSFVYAATGQNAVGQQLIIVDTNHNLDFSDEQEMEPPPLDTIWAGTAKKQATASLMMDYYERGRVRAKKISIAFGQSDRAISYNFPGYASASLGPVGGTGTLLIAPHQFTNPTYKPVVFALADSTRNGRKIYDINTIKEGEYLTVGTKVFVNQGVDHARHILRLAPAGHTDNLYSTQIGYRTYPFTRIKSTTGRMVSLSDYRGKYVLLDFWGTWCGPCRAETPFLRDAYAKTNRTDIEFIGIASEDTPETVDAYCKKEQLSWPQLVADDINNLALTYHINSWPTTILIDPDGKVMIKNVRGKMLVDLLTNLPAWKP